MEIRLADLARLVTYLDKQGNSNFFSIYRDLGELSERFFWALSSGSDGRKSTVASIWNDLGQRRYRGKGRTTRRSESMGPACPRGGQSPRACLYLWLTRSSLMAASRIVGICVSAGAALSASVQRALQAYSSGKRGALLRSWGVREPKAVNIASLHIHV